MEQPTAKHAPWVTQLDALGKQDPDRLRLASQQIAELTIHPGWRFLAGLARDKQAHLHRQIMPPATHTEYEYVALTNQEFGIGLVLDCPEAVLEVARRFDDEHRKAAQRADREGVRA